MTDADDLTEDGREDDGPPEDGLSVANEHETLTLDAARVTAVVDAVCAMEGVRVASLSVVLGDHALVHGVNRDWLEHDYPTDVVSFALDDVPGSLDGEIYVDLDMAAERAPEFGATFETEALRYVAHGALHIAGHDDASDAQRAAMRVLEDRALTLAGVLSPTS